MPSGLTLYWFTNNILTTGQQVGSLCCRLTLSQCNLWQQHAQNLG